MDHTRLRTVLSAVSLGRIATGALALASPTAFLAPLGVDTVTARRTGWVTRMFGVREIALGAGTAAALRGESDPRPWLVASAACDAGDTLALVAAVRGGHLSPATGLPVVGVAVGACVGFALGARG